MPTLPKRRKKNISMSLRKSATDHMCIAIEFFNRPVQSSRHEIAAVLAVTAWEKLLKAYLHRYTKNSIFLGANRTISFDACRLKVSNHLQLTSAFAFEDVSEHLIIMERYRNECVHFVNQGMSTVIHGIFTETTLKFASFLREHFKLELLPSTDIGILPIGYSFPLIAENFINKQSATTGAPLEVLDFLHAMHVAGDRLAQLGVAPENSILVSYRVGLINSKNLAKTDTTVRIDNDQPDAEIISVKREVSEANWHAFYCLRYRDVLNFATAKSIKINAVFHTYLKTLKTDSDVCASRIHDPNNPKSQVTYCYSEKVKIRISSFFKLTD